MYTSLYIHTSMCACMCKILQKSGSLIVTARFHKEFSCSSSCCVSYMYCSLWARALPSLDHWEVLETSPASIREREVPLKCLRDLCVLPFLCHPATNTNWPNKIWPYLHQFWLIYTPRPSGWQKFSSSREIYFNCKVVTAFPHHPRILLLSLLSSLLYQPLQLRRPFQNRAEICCPCLLFLL